MAQQESDLVYMIQRNDIEGVRTAIELGADVNQPSYEGDPPILYTVTGMHKKMRLEPYGVLQSGLDAAKQKAKQILTLLISQENFDPNNVDYKGTPIIFDIYKLLSVQDLDLLIHKGLDVNARRSSDGRTILIEALKWYEEDMEAKFEKIKLLVEGGADVNASIELPSKPYSDHGEPLLYATITLIDPTILQYLIDKGVNVNATNRSLETPLMRLAFEVSLENLDTLLNAKDINVNAQSAGGTTALMRLLGHPKPDVLPFLDKLLEKGADVNLQNQKGKTALILAAEKDKQYYEPSHENLYTQTLYTFVKTLLEHGADKTIRDEKGKTASFYPASPKMNVLFGNVWTGFTPEDRSKFFILLDKTEGPFMGVGGAPIATTKQDNFSPCPFCFMIDERTGGCMVMSHNCTVVNPKNVHMGLYKQYKNPDGNVEWCTYCGRPCVGHYHTTSKVGEPVKRYMTIPAGSTVYGNEEHCKRFGGGGLKEKFARVNLYLTTASTANQALSGTYYKEVHDAMIEVTWNEGLNPTYTESQDFTLVEVYQTDEQKQLEEARKKALLEQEEAPITVFPSNNQMITETGGDAAGAGAGEAKGGYCLVELGVHEDRRPTYRFVHTQPNKSLYEHPKEDALCAEHLAATLKASNMQNLNVCPINAKCKGTVYPADLEAIPDFDPEYLEKYTKAFSNIRQNGGGRRNRTYRRSRKMNQLHAKTV